MHRFLLKTELGGDYFAKSAKTPQTLTICNFSVTIEFAPLSAPEPVY